VRLNDPFRFVYTFRQTKIRGRRGEMAALQEFAGGDDGFRWWSIGGPAGVGKSRLALEAMLDLGPIWRAGFLPRDEGRLFRWHGWNPLYPTFIVIDYAGQRSEEASGIIQALAMRAAADELEWPVRLLLLDRRENPIELPAWSQATLATHALPTRFREPLVLGGLQNEDAIGIAEEIAGADKARATIELLSRIDAENRPLFVSFAAEALQAGEITNIGGWSILRRFWRRTQERFWIPVGAQDTELDAVTLSTICGGLQLRDLRDPAWSDLSLPRPSIQLKERLEAMYATESGSENDDPTIRPLQPSLAGEIFVLDRFHNGLGSDGETLLRAAWRHSPVAVAGFCERSALNLPDHPSSKLLLQVIPDPRDRNAVETWSWFVPRVVRGNLNIGSIEAARYAVERLIEVVEEVPLHSVIANAAYAVQNLIEHLGRQGVQQAGLILARLIEAMTKGASRDREPWSMPPFTRHRLTSLAFRARISPLLGQILNSDELLRNKWAGGLAAALMAYWNVSQELPPLARKKIWNLLILNIEPLVPILPEGVEQSAGEFALRSSLTLLRTGVTNAQVELELLTRNAFLLLESGKGAVERGEGDDAARTAVEAGTLLQQVELSDDEMGAYVGEILELLQRLHALGYFSAAQTLLAEFLEVAEMDELPTATEAFVLVDMPEEIRVVLREIANSVPRAR
jgi:hypothetical protein